MKATEFFKIWYFVLILPFLVLISCGDDDKKSGVIAPGTLTANFESEVDSLNGLLVRFTNLSERAFFYEWDFGDSLTSTEKDPIHEYSAGGVYTITLIAKTANGSSASTTKVLTVSGDSVTPIASFQYEIDTINPFLLRFTNFSQNAISYDWDFGDFGTSNEENPIHEYSEEGTYTITLTATNSEGISSSKSEDVTLTDPAGNLDLLTGSSSKTWKLFREGVSMSLGESKEIPDNYWPGLENNGSRNCLYEHEFTFNIDGSFTFDDKGSFWGEFGVWNPTDPNYETCFPAISSNMININGDDISAWLSGTWSYTYDPITEKVTLNGEGAWIGISKLGENAERLTPTPSTAFTVEIEQRTGYDIMTVGFDYGTSGYWKFVYVNYSDPSLEPALGGGFGQDLPDQTPTALFNSFASTSSGDVQELFPTTSDVTLNVGVNDPSGGVLPVGEYIRGTTPISDLKFQLPYDCQFDNFSSVSIEVYFPSFNNYSGSLSQQVDIFIADASETQEFWTDWVLFVDNTTTVKDQWVTFTFPLNSPINGVDPRTRTDLDLIGLKIGGENHAVDGTFYIRNFVFQ